MSELYDGDGYPTDKALDKLRFFEGTPEQMVEHISSLMRNGWAKVEDTTDQWGRPRKLLTLVTGGWSGYESVIGVLHETLFHFAYWESSFRGGKYTYDIPASMWESEGEWGNPRPQLEVSDA